MQNTWAHVSLFRCFFTHSLTHSLTYSLIHSFIHSLIHSLLNFFSFPLKSEKMFTSYKSCCTQITFFLQLQLAVSLKCDWPSPLAPNLHLTSNSEKNISATLILILLVGSQFPFFNFLNLLWKYIHICRRHY